jgi:hypothetical protein
LGGILQPSDPGSTIRRMFFALLICSDESCAYELETWGTLEGLGARACECGCALQVISVSEVEFVEAAPPAADTWLPLAA